MTRSATIRTEVEDAETLASSVRPDNTPEIVTRVERDGHGIDSDGDADDEVGTVVTTIERETTGGLRTTVDDYVVNLTVAQEVVQAAKRHADASADLANADDADDTTQS